MTTAVLPAGAVAAEARPDHYEARFWRSPFALTAAAVVSAQGLLMVLAAIHDRPFPFEFAFSLTVLALTFLMAGVWPNWNYLRVTPEGVDQQAGLRSFVASWSQVQNIRVFEGWVELRVVTGVRTGERRVRTVRLFNRYALSSEEFGDLVERHWQRARAGRG
ncbi:hypothetical protein [Parvularcula dongshanensis]|uniref:PH domain-containing protein n=1 Tax=Parvularcula dongshanensis TaxID=1173995 RepID=A0A840I0C1_9PROT|nr:hypothetical protein [Parvularcula dongshanensis]MBB4657662.1 hypothetical protein [Parvularcula dongshanensis]